MKTIKTILIAATLISASVVSTVSAQQAAEPTQSHAFKVALGDTVTIKSECQKYLTGEQPSSWVYGKKHTVRQLGTKRFPEGVLLMSIYSWICEDCLIPVSQKAEEQPAPAEPVAEEPAEESAPAPVVEEQPAPAPVVEEEQPAPAPAEPVVEEAPVVEETPAEEPAPVIAPVVVAPVVVATPAEEPAPIVEEQPAPAPAEPVVEEPAPAEPVVEEAPAVEETSAEEPAPVIEEEPAPVVEEEPAPVVEEEPAPALEVKEEPQTVLASQNDTLKSKQNFKRGYDRFTIGVRGGAAGLLHNVTQGQWTCGGDVLLDLQYAHYWTKDGRPVDLGVIVGLGIGYSQSGMKTAVDSTYQVNADGELIDYTLKADEVKEHDGQIQLEIPVMFSLIHANGLFFNVGPKFMLPVYTPYKQTITNPLINAYFETEGVNVSNEVITGLLTEDQLNSKGSDNGNQFAINIMLTAEIGYEWILKSGNSLGLGAYANYCVYNSFKNNASGASLLSVTPPSEAGAATVDVLSATKTYAKGLGYFDVGVKVAYHFNFPKKQYKKYIGTKLF